MIFADIDIDNGNDIYVPHRGLEAVLGKNKITYSEASYFRIHVTEYLKSPKFQR